MNVLRGGSWNNNPRNLRSANRNRNTPDNRNNNNGFRAASTPNGETRRAAGAVWFTNPAGVPHGVQTVSCVGPYRRVGQIQNSPAGAGRSQRIRMSSPGNRRMKTQTPPNPEGASVRTPAGFHSIVKGKRSATLGKRMPEITLNPARVPQSEGDSVQIYAGLVPPSCV